MTLLDSPDPGLHGLHPGLEAESGPWQPRSLAAARPGARYRVTRVLFGLVRERCEGLGCSEGDELVCTANGALGVDFAAEGRGTSRLERDYACFVQVEPT